MTWWMYLLSSACVAAAFWSLGRASAHGDQLDRLVGAPQPGEKVDCSDCGRPIAVLEVTTTLAPREPWRVDCVACGGGALMAPQVGWVVLRRTPWALHVQRLVRLKDPE